MVTKIPGKQIVVNPVETNRTVTTGISTPNLMGGFGAERNFAKMNEENILRYNNLKLEGFNQFALAYQLEDRQDAEDMQLALKTESDFNKNSSKYSEILEKRKARLEKFTNEAKAMKMPQDLIDAAIEGANRSFEITQVIYGKYQTDHWTEERRKANILLYNEQSSLTSKMFLNGDFYGGAENYANNQNDLWKGYENGYLTVEQFVKQSSTEKQNAIFSFVHSKVNDNIGEQTLKEWAEYDYETFGELFKELTGKYGDYEVMLNVDDFNVFKKSINSALNTIKTKETFEKNNNLYEQLKEKSDIAENPAKYVLSKYPNETPLNLVGKDVAVEITNTATGGNYNDILEIILSGKPLITQDKETSLVPLYRNTSGEETIKQRINEAKKWTDLEYNVENIAILDSQNKELAGRVLGGVGTFKAMTNHEFYKTQAEIYSENNLKAQAIFDGVKIDENVFIKNAVETHINYRNKTSAGELSYIGSWGGAKNYGDIIETSILDINKAVYALQELATFGDPMAIRLYNDIAGNYGAVAKTVIAHETGGMLSQELAEELKIKKYNVPIESLDVSEKEKILSYYTNSTDKLTRSKSTFTEAMLDNFGKQLEYWFEDFQTVDTGNIGGVLLLPKEMNGEKVREMLLAKVTTTSDFYTTPTLESKASKRQIKFQYRIGSNIIVPTYAGKPLYNENGIQIVYDITGMEKEVEND